MDFVVVAFLLFGCAVCITMNPLEEKFRSCRVSLRMSRIRVPYTGITTQRQTQQTLTDKQLGLVAKLAEECNTWEKKQGSDLEDLPPANNRRSGQEFVAGKFNSSIEADLASEAAGRNEGENRGMAAFREQLPAFEMKEELLAAVKRHQVVVVSGETGCGKTTQVRILFFQAFAW